MRPQTRTLNANGTSTPILHDVLLNPFSASFTVTADAGTTATVTVQHTLQDPNASTLSVSGQCEQSTAIPVTWTNDANINGATVSSTNPLEGNYMFPVCATQLVVSNISGGGNVYLTLIQAGGSAR